MSKTTNFTRGAFAAAFTVAVMTFATSSMAAPPAAAPGAPKPPGAGVPAPKILVIDRSMILRDSAVGKSIVQQVNAITQQAENEFKGTGASLRSEEQALQQQLAILAPNVRQQKIKAFQAKQAAFQQKVNQRQLMIQGGIIQARQQVEKALGPILQGIMQERGANLLLDRQSVVLGTVDVDITNTAIQRLNQKLPTVKVQLVAPPAGTVAPQQAGQ